MKVDQPPGCVEVGLGMLPEDPVDTAVPQTHNTHPLSQVFNKAMSYEQYTPNRAARR